MAEDDLTWQFDIEFVPLYIPPNVKYFERDGLKCGTDKINAKNF